MNQTPVSDADREIPTLGSTRTRMPETRQTSFPALSVYPRVGISLSASEADDRFYFFFLIKFYLSGVKTLERETISSVVKGLFKESIVIDLTPYR